MSDKKVWKNKQGEVVHPDMIRADEKLRDELVEEILGKVHLRRQGLTEFKTEIVDDINAYLSTHIFK